MDTNATNLYQNATNNSSNCLILQAKEFIPWDNPDNVVSFQTAESVKKLKIFAILPLTFLIGVPANVINMAVFYRHGLKERINVCLFALSLADGLFLVVTMLTKGEQIYFLSTTKERYGPMNQWITNNHLVGFYGLAWVSQVLSAIVASERCFCILQPLKSQAILSTSTMTAVVVAVFFLVTGVRFFVNMRYYITCAYDPVNDSMVMTSVGSQFYKKHKSVIDFLDIFVYGLGLPWMVIIVVVSTTVVTVVKLRQAAEWRMGVSSNSGGGCVTARDIALTRMLVGNSLFFICCVFPVGLYRVSMMFLPEMGAGRRQHNLFFAGLWLTNSISNINATFNIVVYYTMGSRYRQTVHTLLGRKTTKDIRAS